MWDTRDQSGGTFSNTLANLTIGLSAALFAAGCSNDHRNIANSPDRAGNDALVVKAPSPVPSGQTLSEFLEERTSELHTQSRGTNFIRSYKENFMTTDQYVSNLVQRYTILKAALDESHTNPRLREILGQEPEDLLNHFAQDLKALGKPPSSISDADVLETTKVCLAFINDSAMAKLAAAHIYVGGAGNGGRYIGKGIQKCLGTETPVLGFTGTPHEAVEKFEERFNAIAPENHQAIIDAEVRLFQLFNQLNDEPAYGNSRKG